MSENVSADVETYSAEVDDYLAEADWIGPHDKLFVGHVRRLARQLDAGGNAALYSAYMQAISRLDKRRPGATPDGEIPGQSNIFEQF